MSGNARGRYVGWVAFAYFALSIGWIFLSDRLLSMLADVDSIVWLSTAKGLFFVVSTTVLLIFALHRMPAGDPSETSGYGLHELTPVASGRPGHWLVYAFAVLLPLAAIVMHEAMAAGNHLMLILLMLPIILSALLGGLGPGLVATAVAAAGANFWIIHPLYTLEIADTQVLIQWVFLLINGVAVSLLSAQLRRSQNHAEARRQQLDAIVSGTSDSIFVKDLRGRYRMINAAGARIIGRPVRDILGKDDGQLFPAETAALLRQKDREVLAACNSVNHEEHISTADGTTFAFSVTKGPVFDANGHVKGVFGISRDITDRVRFEADLRESEDLYRTAFSASPDAITIACLPDGRYRSVNPSFESLFGWSAAEILGKTPQELQLWVDPDMAAHCLEQGQLADGFDDLHTELRTRDGRLLSVTMSSHPIRIQGEPCVLTVTRDISARKKADEELHIASLVYQSTSEGMMVTDAANRIIAVNPAFEVISGYRADEVLGKDPGMLNSRRAERSFYEAMWRELRETGRWEGDIWNRHKSGALYLEHLTINTIRSPDGSVHRRVALFSDITQKKETEDFIWRQANFDLLTQLPNRQMFQDRLQQEIKRAHRSHESFALLFLDLDNFKEINDTLGHPTGDLLLTEAAQRISGCVREMDTCARMGGDEFAVLLSGTALNTELERVALKILDKLSEPFMLNDSPMVISASIGITTYPADGQQADVLLKNADQAMYVAKKLGRNQHSYFTPDLHAAALHRLRLINDLRQAVPQGQLRLHFQPIVHLASGRIYKGEALVRWMHPQQGLISPAEFIPHAEDSGLIVPIGDWVFQEAARWTQTWRSRFNPQFQISINKSPLQFQKSVTAMNWIEHLDRMGLPGEAIAVEITEGVLMNTDPSVNRLLLEYRQRGLKISIDDFGTGYSSLSYLKKFDIDFLKIDQSFTRNLAPGSSDMALSEAIIVMAHKLGLKVIAEGVETPEQRDLLASVGCDYGQGYLFSKPVPPEEFEVLLQQSGASAPG